MAIGSRQCKPSHFALRSSMNAIQRLVSDYAFLLREAKKERITIL